jgi:hypothetical protein
MGEERMGTGWHGEGMMERAWPGRIGSERNVAERAGMAGKEMMGFENIGMEGIEEEYRGQERSGRKGIVG